MKTSPAIRALLHALLLACAAGSTAPSSAQSVRGIVRSALGSPVQGALVEFEEVPDGGVFSSVTGIDGRYEVDLAITVAESDADGGATASSRPTLDQNYPNPFNPSSTIAYSLAVPATVDLAVYNVLGHRVNTLDSGWRRQGIHSVMWNAADGDGRGVSAGLYFYRLTVDGDAITRKMILLDGPTRGVDSPGPLRHTVVEAAKSEVRRFNVRVSGTWVVQRQYEDLVVVGTTSSSTATLDIEGVEVVSEQLALQLPSGVPTQLVGIPAGAFAMGSWEYDDEMPVRDVRLDPFYMQSLEVTVAEYAGCVDDGACDTPAQGEACNWAVEGRLDHPANCISWYDAARYCQWAEMRLPTEAEWERAARGVEGASYPWGDEPPGGAGDCQRAVMMKAGVGLGCGYNGTGPVGSRFAGRNTFGLADMAGNVWEWVADWYDAEFYGHSDDRNPLNDEPSEHKALRGNSWFYVDPDADMRAANRYRFRPLRWYPYIGVRCARSATPAAVGESAVASPAAEEAALRLSTWWRRNRAAAQAECDTLSAKADGGVPGEMVLIPGGLFSMGSDVNSGDERPRRQVFVDSFYVDRFEVTVGEYRSCVVSNHCTRPHTGSAAYQLEFEAEYLNWDQPGRDLHPVNAVSWYQADQYCRWADKRLPSEAEWEKAATGTDDRKYPWGDAQPSCDQIVMDDSGDGCGQEQPWPVGSRTAGASPYGVMDMSGNVWEWTTDWYDPAYYASGPDRNPLNTDQGVGLKVLRGGSFADQNPYIHRAANRLGYDPKQRFDYTIGFRCARDDEPR